MTAIKQPFATCGKLTATLGESSQNTGNAYPISRVGRMCIVRIAFVLMATFSATRPMAAAEILPLGEAISVEATIEFINVEGGCWVFDTKFGRLAPLTLDAKFKVDGMKVMVTIQRQDEIATTCQVGNYIVKVLSIGKPAPDS
jgi:hypothetical protein